MMKSKLFIGLLAIGVLSYSLGFAAQNTSKQGTGTKGQTSTQGTGTTGGGAQGGTMGTTTGNTTVEQAASWVQDPTFADWIMKNPDMANQIAQYPYSAYLFYQRPDFKAWSDRYPSQAQMIMNSAMRWNRMSDTEKEQFFRLHPTLRAQGGAQGGSMGGASTGSQQSGK